MANTVKLLRFPFLLNNVSLSELLGSEDDEGLEISKCCHFDIKVALNRLMIAIDCFKFQDRNGAVFQNGAF